MMEHKILFLLLNLIILSNNLVNSQPIQKRGLGDAGNDSLIFLLCVIIPAVFVIIIFTLVVYAKKNVEKSELKRAQNTNASSLSSMNFSSKNLLYSRGNGSGNRSGLHNENPMDYTPKANAVDMGMNNINLNGYNMGIPNNNSIMPNNIMPNNIMPNQMDVLNNNNDAIDFNTQLLMAKNYRIQGYGTSSLPRSSQSSPLSSPYLKAKEQTFKLNQPEGVVYAKDKTYTVPTIPGIEDTDNRNHYKKENYEIKMTHRPQPKQYGYNKSYNDIKKSEQRISVSPPLRDWNDSYYTVEEANPYENKKDYKKNMDSLSRNYKSNIKPKYANEYVMSLTPPKSQSISEKEKINIIEQYDQSDSFSTQSSNSDKYIKNKPYSNYSSKY
jgi:hypothetical protein